MNAYEVKEWAEAGFLLALLVAFVAAIIQAHRPQNGPDPDDQPDRLVLDYFDLEVLSDEGNAVRVQSEQGEVYGLKSIDYGDHVRQEIEEAADAEEESSEG